MKNNQNKKNIVSLLLILAIVAISMYYIRPMSAQVDAKQLELEQAEARLTDLQNTVTRLSSLADSLPSNDKEKQLLLSQVPSSLDQDGIIKDLSTLARNRGIELKNIGFALNGIDPETGIGAVTMSTGFEGTYQDLITLLSDMENNVRKFRVKNISVQVLEASRSETTDVTFTLTIEAYYQG